MMQITLIQSVGWIAAAIVLQGSSSQNSPYYNFHSIISPHYNFTNDNFTPRYPLLRENIECL